MHSISYYTNVKQLTGRACSQKVHVFPVELFARLSPAPEPPGRSCRGIVSFTSCTVNSTVVLDIWPLPHATARKGVRLDQLGRSDVPQPPQPDIAGRARSSIDSLNSCSTQIAASLPSHCSLSLGRRSSLQALAMANSVGDAPGPYPPGAAPPPPGFSVLILKEVKVVCFDTLLQVLILKNLYCSKIE